MTDCSLLARFRSNDDGATAILFALMAAVLFGMAGLALDYNRGTHLKTEMQAALDAAVIAAMQAEPEDRAARAAEYFKANLNASSALSIALNFTEPAANQLKGVATTKINTTLARVFSVNTLDVSTQATAAADSSGKVCILVLDAAAPQALLVNNGAQISAPNCEIHVKSKAAPAAVFNAGTSIDSLRLCISGSNVIDNGGSHPNTQTSCTTADDPYVGRYPDPSSASCDVTNMNYNGGAVTLNPGVYCGWTNFNAAPTVTFQPGVYVIKGGGWNVNGGTWTGNGVTFFFADQSKIQFNSGVAATISAPTAGPYKDVVIFEAGGLVPSPFVLDDSIGMNLTGLIYLPSRDTTFNAASNLFSKDTTLVVKTLILDQTNWSLDSTSTEIGGSSGPLAVRLVE